MSNEGYFLWAKEKAASLQPKPAPRPAPIYAIGSQEYAAEQEVNATDHEGGGWVQVFQVKGGKLVKETDWFRAYPEVVAAAVAKAE